MKFVAAFRFLTVIPLPVRREITAGDMAGSTVYFPTVGLLLGLLLAALYYLLSLFLPRGIATIAVFAAGVLVNGGIHADGFIDTCDGLAGNRTPEERWRIMKDSRVGAFGVLGAVFLFLAKYAALTSLPHDLVLASIVAMPVLSRWMMAYSIVAYPYAKPEGLGTAFKKNAGWRDFALATASTALFTLAIFWLGGVRHPYVGALAVASSVWALGFAWSRYLSWKFAGLTGDSYGAISELCELAVITVVSLFAFNRLLFFT